MSKGEKMERKEAGEIALIISINTKGIKNIGGGDYIRLCGSFRRGLAFVSDLDFVVVLDDKQAFHDSVLKYSTVTFASGDRKVRILVEGDRQVDFMIVDEEEYESAILHSTGSAKFNINCRYRAKTFGLKLNEYGLWRGNSRIASTEKEILSRINMAQYLDPKRRNM